MSDKESELLSKGVVIAWDEGLMTKEEMERARAYLDALAAAEQRATDAEARAERLAAVLEETYQYLIWLRKPIDLPDSRWPFTCGEAALDDKIHAALTAPATQPDERAAAVRAALLYVHLVASEGITGDYIFTEAERIARLLEATDGAAKETT